MTSDVAGLPRIGLSHQQLGPEPTVGGDSNYANNPRFADFQYTLRADGKRGRIPAGIKKGQKF